METQAPKIEIDALLFRGVWLDRMTERGPRGGIHVWYRAAFARDFQYSAWHHTRHNAARIAPGYNQARKLTPFDLWMISQQLDYIKIHGCTHVLNNLRAQGYYRIADEVARRYNAQ